MASTNLDSDHTVVVDLAMTPAEWADGMMRLAGWYCRTFDDATEQGFIDLARRAYQRVGAISQSKGEN